MCALVRCVYASCQPREIRNHQDEHIILNNIKNDVDLNMRNTVLIKDLALRNANLQMMFN